MTCRCEVITKGEFYICCLSVCLCLSVRPSVRPSICVCLSVFILVYFYCDTFLSPVVGGGELSASRPGHFTHPPITHWVECLVACCCGEEKSIALRGDRSRLFGAIRGLVIAAICRHLCDINSCSKRPSVDDCRIFKPVLFKTSI